MWLTVLIFALAALGEPVRVGVIAILVSLPRPMRNLLAYWLGLMTMGLGTALAGLFLLRDLVAPISRFVTSAVHSPVAPPIQIALGVLALSSTAMLVRRSSMRQAVHAPVQSGCAPVLVQEPKTPTVFSRLSWTNLVERGAVWMSFLAGLSTSTPPIEFWGAVMAILASGAAVGTQVSAALVFVLLAYGIAEIPLVGYLAFPAKTQAVVMRVHDWLRAHRRPIMIYMFCLFGVFMIATGVGNS
jgi:Sap, sulfolipid-1-addressing protein